MREHALRDEAGRIMNHGDWCTVRRKQPVRRGAHLGPGDRRGHQGAPLGERKQTVDGDGSTRVEVFGERRGGRVLADRRDDAKGAARGHAAVIQHRTEFQRQLPHLRAEAERADPHMHRSHRRGGLLGFYARRQGELAFGIHIEAAAGRLAPEHPCRQALRGDGGGRVARFLVILVIDRLHHRVRDIQPGEVEQLKGTHAETRRVAQHPIDVVEIGDAFACDPECLGSVAAAGVIDDEPGRVLGPHRLVAAAVRE